MALRRYMPGKLISARRIAHASPHGNVEAVRGRARKKIERGGLSYLSCLNKPG